MFLSASWAFNNVTQGPLSFRLQALPSSLRPQELHWWPRGPQQLSASHLQRTRLKGQDGELHRRSYGPHFFILFCFFIELMGWHWFIRSCSFHIYNSTSSVWCGVCSPPQAKSPSITIYPPLPSSSLPFPGNHHTLICIHESYFLSFFFFLCLIPSPFSPSPKPFPLMAVSLFSVSRNLSYLC